MSSSIIEPMQHSIFIMSCLIAACYTLDRTTSYNASTIETSNKIRLADDAIENCITTFSGQETEPAPSGWFFWFVHEPFSKDLSLKMTCIDKQTEVHPPHQHPDREIYYIIEGQAEVFLNGERRVIGANSSVYCPPGVMHGIRRVDEFPLKYLVIKEHVIIASSVEQTNKAYTLDNCVTVFSETQVETIDAGWFFWFSPKSLTNGLNLKMSYVDKQTAAHPAHQHAGSEIVYLLEGQAEVFINGETRTIGPNTSVYYPEYSMHGLKRSGNQPIKYFVIRVN